MKCHHCETRPQELEERPLCKKCAKWIDLCFDTPPPKKNYFGLLNADVKKERDGE